MGQRITYTAAACCSEGGHSSCRESSLFSSGSSDPRKKNADAWGMAMRKLEIGCELGTAHSLRGSP
eukprot:3385623-Rhodomonas_salina.1